MKKYLMTAMAAVAMGVAFTSCSHNTDLYGGEEGSGKVNGRSIQEQLELDKAVYKAAFEQTFGKVAPAVDWGFGSGSASTRAFTRAITVNGDTYNKFPSTSEINSYFPTAIPEDADEVSELLTKYQGTKAQTPWGETTMYDLYAIYTYKIVEGYNLKITSAGTFDVGGCKNHDWDNAQQKDVYKYYNVYVDVPNNGEVIINRPQDSHFNLYILHGNVKMGPTQASQWSCQAISVGSGATFTDNRDEIAANGGVKLYNRGTVYATNSTKYDIGNFCTVYNEGRFEVTGPLTYSPADANASYFMNHGDNAVLKAPSMTLNSSGNFFNDGNVEIEGATTVTNDGIYWVNAGHYKTGSMTFSAGNTTFYNYCNLICTGHMKLYTGRFNMMDNSYMEAGSANFGQDYFRVEMGNNSGVNIKGNVRFESNRDGTEQGFFATGTKAYVRIEGKAQVEKHKYVFVLDGNITYAIRDGVENLEPYDAYYAPYSEFRSGTTEVKAEDFAKFNATPNTNSCGATWTTGGETETYTYRVIVEDLSASQGSDFDFNDVVFDVDPDTDGQGATIKILAAGGIWPLTINSDDPTVNEVHKLLIPSIGKTNIYKKDDVEYECYPMINTGVPEPKGTSTDNEPTIHVTGDYSDDTNIRQSIKGIVIKVYKYGDTDGVELQANKGEAACKVLVDKDFGINSEYNSLATGNHRFKEYVTGRYTGSRWWADVE
jgi:hypothetical protein